MNDKGKHRSKLYLASKHVQVYTIELKGKIVLHMNISPIV